MGNYLADTTTSLSNYLVGHSFSGTAASLTTEVITMAEAEVNGYLSKRYNIATLIAMTTTAPEITRTTKLIASYYFLMAQGRAGKETKTKAETLYKSAITCLEALKEGDADLTDSDGNLVEDKTTNNYRVLSNTKDWSNTFNEDTVTSWTIDDDKLDDIASERNS